MALRPCIGVLLEGALTSGMCVGEGRGGQAAPAGLVCALGVGRGSGPQEHGLGTRSPAPHPRPQVPGVPEPSSGVQGYMQGSVPPPGLDPVRKEINKKGREGG